MSGIPPDPMGPGDTAAVAAAAAVAPDPSLAAAAAAAAAAADAAVAAAAAAVPVIPSVSAVDRVTDPAARETLAAVIQHQTTSDAQITQVLAMLTALTVSVQSLVLGPRTEAVPVSPRRPSPSRSGPRLMEVDSRAGVSISQIPYPFLPCSPSGSLAP